MKMESESTVIDNTELALDVPKEEETPKEKKVVKYILEMQSDDTCEACSDTEGLIEDDLAKKTEIPIDIEKTEASDEQKEKGVPLTKVCKIYEDGSRECGEGILGADREKLVKELDIKEESQDSSDSEVEGEPEESHDSTDA